MTAETTSGDKRTAASQKILDRRLIPLYIVPETGNNNKKAE